MKRSVPPPPEFKIKGAGDVVSEREKWISLIKEHAYCPNYDFVHPFFWEID